LSSNVTKEQSTFHFVVVSCTQFIVKKKGERLTLPRREEKRRKANMSMPYWRAAGMTYVGYANACAVLVRKCMKEPFKSQTATRERVHFKLSQWLDGVPQQPSKLIPPSSSCPLIFFLCSYLLLLLLLLLMLSSSSSSSSYALIFFFFFFLCSHLLLLLLLLLMLSSSSSSSSYALIFFFFFFLCSHLLLLLLLMLSSSSFVLLSNNNSSFFFFLLLCKALFVVQVFFVPPFLLLLFQLVENLNVFFIGRGEGLCWVNFRIFFNLKI